ncbi:MAG: DUF3108 domain-containing protein, partial [Hyphomicrobium sp.]
MRYGVWLSGSRGRLAAVLLLPLSFGSGLPAGAGSGPLPAHVVASYRISFGVLGKIGTFNFKSDVNGDAYNLSADAKIDTAVFDYNGAMTSIGTVLSSVARPSYYTFRFRQKALLSSTKAKSLGIGFDETGVRHVKWVPPDDFPPGFIPVTQAQLRNVLDPLAGVMSLAVGDTEHPCERRLPIFDGRQRFDLVFTPAGNPVPPTVDQVCHVRMIPISGYKPGEGSESVISGTIEVILRPVPLANIVIPYRVTVPTIIGAAVLTSIQADITMPDQQRIAMR